MKTYKFLACFSLPTSPLTPSLVPTTKPRQPSVKESRLNCDEVFETLGHLAARNGEVAGVEEVAHPHVIVKVRLRLEKKWRCDS
jgi:hypothetical protein